MPLRGKVWSVGLAGALLLAGCAAHRAAVNGNPEYPYPPEGGAKVGDIYHLPTGLALSENGLMEMLSGARLVCVGETHDNLNDQRVELTVVRELHRRFPGKVAVGMEMFREPQQAALDRWVKGELTELEFLKASKWYETWGYDFGAYRDLLLFAKENRIDVIALNPSKELQEAVRRTGLDNVPEDLRRKLPEIDETDPWQRVVLRGVFVGHGGHGGGDEIVRLLPSRPAALGGDDGAEGGRIPEESPRGGEADGDDHRRVAREIRLRTPEEGGAPPSDGVCDPAPRGDQHAGAERGAADAGGAARGPAAPGPFRLVCPVYQHRGEAGPHGGPDGGEGGASRRRFRRAGIPGGKSRDREGRRAPRARRAAGEGNRRRLLPGRGESAKGTRRRSRSGAAGRRRPSISRFSRCRSRKGTELRRPRHRLRKGVHI